MSEFADLMSGPGGLADALAGPLGVLVDYTPLDGDVIRGVQASLGRSEFDIDDPDAGSVVHESRDYLIKVADLVDADGNVVTPRRGDAITEVETGIVHTVMLPAVNMTVWKYLDPTRSTRRVHTKQTGSA